MARFRLAVILASATLAVLPLVGRATPPSDYLFPMTSKAYVGVPDPHALEQGFQATQFGKMLEDPQVKEFADDLRAQFTQKLDESSIRLGISWNDLVEVSRGEIALAIVQPGNVATEHAALGIVDVTGNEAAAQALVARIGVQLVAQQGAQASQVTIAGQPAAQLTIPAKEGVHAQRNLYYLIHQGTLLAGDNAKEIQALIGRWEKGAGSLAAHVPYVQAMKKVALQGRKPHVKWFVDPLGYAEVARELDPNRRPRKNDLVVILRRQGFDAIKGVAGVAELNAPQFDVLHRTYVYAPGPFTKAAQMLDFPASPKLEPLPFVPENVSLNADFRWNVKEAFEHSKLLVDDIAEDKIFDAVVEQLRDDPSGPRIDLRGEIVANLGDRVALFSDLVQPITPNSERLAAAIELTNPAAVKTAIDRSMGRDPTAIKELVGDVVVWRMVNEEEGSVKEPKIPAFGGFGDAPEEVEDEREKLFKTWAISVWNGYLIVSSDFTLLRDIISGGKQPLAATADYQAVAKALDALQGGKEVGRLFNRNSESFRSTWELVRTGQMPESQTLLGKFLNRALGPKEKGVIRKQEIDGEKMPAFEAVQKYFAPSGTRIFSDETGWFATGGVLNAQAAGGQPDAVAGDLPDAAER
ncbi:MAG TPA: hypothetical protein VGN57_20245 [Pirellulaceae bacterium]|nr:hypothetical protein [Pirellulaceae bacterium]